MSGLPSPGDLATVEYEGSRGEKTVTGIVIAGRYPDMYLTIEDGSTKDILRLPLSAILRVNGEPL